MFGAVSVQVGLGAPLSDQSINPRPNPPQRPAVSARSSSKPQRSGTGLGKIKESSLDETSICYNEARQPPSMVIVPAVNSLRPAIAFRSVDFPEPFGPMMVVMSDDGTSKVDDEIATVFP